MAAKIVQYSAIVIALLVLGMIVTQVRSCTYTDYVDEDDEKTKQRQMLLELFKEAIMNNDDTLWKLQQIYFNPNSNQSPGQVCISIFVNADILDPSCPCNNQKGPAFENELDQWYFNTYYELQLADDASDHDTSELARLMTESGSTSIFYSFDPSFHSITKTLSSSIALTLPYSDDVYTLYYYSNDYIGIDISTDLNEMPCWNDAVYALRSVLMWVSVTDCPQNAMSCNFHPCTIGQILCRS